MAAAAVGAELPVVHVVRTMTGAAAGRRPGTHCRRVCVTGVTGKGRMRAVQWEAGIAVVIEGGCLPRIARVAVAALGPEGAFVRIVVCVAAAAVPRGVLEAGIGMAGAAGDGRMQAQQRKVGKVMIEAQRTRPRRLRMTSRTFAGQLARVHVIERVAAVTGVRYRLLRPHLVACRTVEFRMGCYECEPGACMLEGGSAPGGRIVAAAAIGPEATLVHVVCRMAGYAA